MTAVASEPPPGYRGRHINPELPEPVMTDLMCAYTAQRQGEQAMADTYLLNARVALYGEGYSPVLAMAAIRQAWPLVRTRARQILADLAEIERMTGGKP